MMGRTIFAITGAFMLSACMSQADTGAVESAAAQFFEHQAQGNDQAIYDAATPAFRSSARLDDLVRLNTVVRAVSGCSAPARNPGVLNNTLNTSGHFISVAYNRTCDGGPLTESFTFQIINGRAQLLAYNVNGMALFPAAPQPAEPAPAPVDLKPPASEAEPA